MTSYKWIEECCKLGELVDTESHKIYVTGGKSNVFRTARRNEFSAADDRILLEHLKTQVARGAAIKGNLIYDSLAQLVC
jgi:hypothetical protein